MKSIKMKIMALTLGVTLLSAIAIGGAGIISAGKVIDADSAKIMDSYCIDQAQKINGTLEKIEQSVRTVSDYAAERLEDVGRFQTDEAYVDEYTARINDILLNAVKHTEGAVSAYIRYNPDFTDPVSGLFYIKDAGGSEFKKIMPTDLSRYEKDDDGHVGWYYIPVQSGKPTWMLPYENKNINVLMISYIIPLEVDGVSIGIIGMDIDFNLLKNIVDDTKVFQGGYAFLTDHDYNIIYHKDYVMYTPLTDIDSGLQSLAVELQNNTESRAPVSYMLEGEEWKAVYQGMNNSMKLVLTAPASTINESRTDLVGQICMITLCIGSLTLVFTFFVTRRMARPLVELNIAAQKIADGDLSVTIRHRSNDEIGTLAESFRKTVKQLEKHIAYIKRLAYLDSLTGVKSKTAYMEAVDKIDEEIRIEKPVFGIAVFDINNLKDINDGFGHDRGDVHIIDACRIICRTFKRSPVYRIGGDEFVAILTGNDLNDYQQLAGRFDQEIAGYNGKAECMMAIARGMAAYDSETDLAFMDVFKRADAHMYHHKEQLKRSVNDGSAADEANEDKVGAEF